MKIIGKTKDSDIATVYIGETSSGSLTEFVESVQPPIPLEKKWVLIVSTMKGCPVGCKFCDSGSYYEGKLSESEIIEQIDYLIRKRFPNGIVPVNKFKIQFARMGDPALNMAVIKVLKVLPDLYHIPGFLPSISTIAPNGTDNFFDELLEIKETMYENNFQLQFSLHSTNEQQRDWIIPVKKWSFSRIASYANSFVRFGNKKISLNFALSKETILEPNELIKFFDPEKFLIKITPVNPTFMSSKNEIDTFIQPDSNEIAVIDEIRNNGYQVILSIGEWEENRIGSNCGQQLLNNRNKDHKLSNSYTYEIVSS
jgi:23S rRNA (adenine2503-C2)-methyltransferase